MPARRRTSRRERYEVLVGPAVAHWKRDRFQAALDVLDGLLDEFAAEPELWGMRGTMLQALGRDLEALAAFRETVWLSPSSELASRCLFDSLLEVGRVGDAFLEARRFLDQGASSDYREVIATQRGRTLLPGQKPTAAQIRQAGARLGKHLVQRGRPVFASKRTGLQRL